MGEPSFSLGIEEEYFLVDPASRNLAVEPPPGFMQACEAALGDRVSHEFLKSQVEVQTPPCADLPAARAELVRLRRGVIEAARAHGMAAVACSTHPFATWREQRTTRSQRYDAIAGDMQATIQRMVCGSMHIHAGIEDDEERIDLMNRLAGFLPHFLAYTTSSPFWRGEDTGLKAYRAAVLRDLPRGGLPDHLGSYAEWQDALAVLKDTGLCADGSRMWWDLRPSVNFPTLELRVCDLCTRLDDALAVAALYQALLATLRARPELGREPFMQRRMLVAENKWQAERYGVEGGLADFAERRRVPFNEITERLLALVGAAAERLGCRGEVEGLRRIAREGTSAEGQRAAYARARAGGADHDEALRAVVDWLAAETAASVIDP